MRTRRASHPSGLARREHARPDRGPRRRPALRAHGPRSAASGRRRGFDGPASRSASSTTSRPSRSSLPSAAPCASMASRARATTAGSRWCIRASSPARLPRPNCPRRSRRLPRRRRHPAAMASQAHRPRTARSGPHGPRARGGQDEVRPSRPSRSTLLHPHAALGRDVIGLQERSAPAWRRLIFDELLAQQITLRESRAVAFQRTAPPLAGDDAELVGCFLAQLPFNLTNAQRRVTDEILADLAANRPCTASFRATSAAARPS